MGISECRWVVLGKHRVVEERTLGLVHICILNILTVFLLLVLLLAIVLMHRFGP